jgi:hypothetical protein
MHPNGSIVFRVRYFRAICWGIPIACCSRGLCCSSAPPHLLIGVVTAGSPTERTGPAAPRTPPYPARNRGPPGPHDRQRSDGPPVICRAASLSPQPAADPPPTAGVHRNSTGPVATSSNPLDPCGTEADFGQLTAGNPTNLQTWFSICPNLWSITHHRIWSQSRSTAHFTNSYGNRVGS